MAKKKQAVGTYEECFSMKLFKWEEVIYLDFELAWALMIEYLVAEGLTSNKTKEEVLAGLNGPLRMNVVMGMKDNSKTDVVIVFKKLNLVLRKEG